MFFKVPVIVEGESLFNDGTAAVFFQVILAGILTGDFSLADGIRHFLIVSVGGAGSGVGVSAGTGVSVGTSSGVKVFVGATISVAAGANGTTVRSRRGVLVGVGVISATAGPQASAGSRTNKSTPHICK